MLMFTRVVATVVSACLFFFLKKKKVFWKGARVPSVPQTLANKGEVGFFFGVCCPCFGPLIFAQTNETPPNCILVLVIVDAFVYAHNYRRHNRGSRIVCKVAFA